MRSTTPAGRGRRRTQQTLEDAELRLVARVVTDGGIGRWRAVADLRLRTAHATFVTRGRLSRAVAASLVVALADEPIRDRCWRMVESQCDSSWPAFWLCLSRRALPPYRSEPLFLLAWSAWRLGDVRLARAAADEALAEDAGHRAAAMLLALLRMGVDPGRLPFLTDRSSMPAGAS
jgi:Domain of unknown function (DUF4192)